MSHLIKSIKQKCMRPRVSVFVYVRNKTGNDIILAKLNHESRCRQPCIIKIFASAWKSKQIIQYNKTCVTG